MTSSRRKARAWPYPRHRHYREEVEQGATAWFARRHLRVRPQTPYVLSHRDDWTENIIDSKVVRYVRQVQEERSKQGRGFSLHRWIHHGLSSQALLFNLIGPLIVRDELGVLGTVFARRGFQWPSGPIAAQLEYEDRAIFNEDYGQPTSIDLVLLNAGGQAFLFCECKFVEREFGGCSVYGDGDCDGRSPARDFSLCYLHHIGRRYWELLDKHGFLGESLVNETTCILANHYQFFRNLLFALEYGGSFVLLSDERSPVFDCDAPQGRRGLMPLLLSLIPEAIWPKVMTASIQQVVSAIKESGRHPWIAEFERKYGLI